MDLCIQASSATNPNCSLVQSGEIDITGSVLTVLPPELWYKIFNYLGFQDLKLFTEYKVKVLKKTLDGSEDNHRLMMGKSFIFHREKFFNVVQKVYNVALCCKEFYLLTQRERKLLINGAERARLDPEFFPSRSPPSVIGPILMLPLPGPPPRFSPPGSPSWFSPSDPPSFFSRRDLLIESRGGDRFDRLMFSDYAQLCESAKSFKIELVKLEPIRIEPIRIEPIRIQSVRIQQVRIQPVRKLVELFTRPFLGIDIFKKIEATEGQEEENQTSTE